ncbi:MAG: ABC transporter ATP-binding protein [Hyphomicrobiaceae bacterium]|nr:MAG: ABC transporter ATP-binding protein [Hyphomicrobiaceae bacterium]
MQKPLGPRKEPAVPPVEVENLRKCYGDVVAVDGISFSMARGKVTALLGGNGAGKTTTIAILLGLVTPTSGRVRVLGVDMVRRREQVLHRVNFSSPYVTMPMRLTVTENLEVFGRLYGIADLKARIAEVADQLGISELLSRPAGELSAGQKTRVGLAKALINQPELLLLDEPTASLDPDTADWVRGELMAYVGRHGASILLASHNMTEVERLAERAIMLQEGRIVADGSPAELIERFGRRTLEEVFLDIARGRDKASDKGRQP